MLSSMLTAVLPNSDGVLLLIPECFLGLKVLPIAMIIAPKRTLTSPPHNHIQDTPRDKVMNCVAQEAMQPRTGCQLLASITCDYRTITSRPACVIAEHWQC